MGKSEEELRRAADSTRRAQEAKIGWPGVFACLGQIIDPENAPQLRQSSVPELPQMDANYLTFKRLGATVRLYQNEVVFGRLASKPPLLRAPTITGTTESRRSRNGL